MSDWPQGSRIWPEEGERGTLGAVLGAGCVDADAGLRVLRRARATGLHPSHFGLAAYGAIYAAMLKLAEDGLPVDPVSVAAELDREHVDPWIVSKLRVLAHELAPFTAIERYAAIVRDAAEQREIEERGAT
jgi:replicative DNA helicase